MSKILKTWILNGLSLWVIDYFAEGVSFSDFSAVAVTALALTVLNSTIKPILNALALPMRILTFGLFSFVINGLVLWIAFSVSGGSSISSFGYAILISIVLAVLNSFFEKVFGK